MKVEIFTICDRAHAENKKLTIEGALNKVRARKYPYMHPCFLLFARLVFDETEKCEHLIDVYIKGVNDDTYVIDQRGMRLDLTKTEESFVIADMMMECKEVVIPAAGNYIMGLTVDDKTFFQTHFIAEQIPVRPMEPDFFRDVLGFGKGC